MPGSLEHLVRRPSVSESSNPCFGKLCRCLRLSETLNQVNETAHALQTVHSQSVSALTGY